MQLAHPLRRAPFSTPFGTKGVGALRRGDVEASRPARVATRGFTLIELMVTLAIGAILLTIAVPSFRRLILSSRLTTTATALSDAINFARLDAIKLNSTTQFCGSSANANSNDVLGTACGTDAGAVYAQPQGATTAQLVRATPPGVTSSVQISGAGISAIRFSGQGFGYAPGAGPDTPYNATVAVVCTSQLATDNQRIISMTAGSVVATASSTGSCP